MPKAVLGTGAVVVNENATILKNFNVEMGTEHSQLQYRARRSKKEGHLSLT